MRVPGRQLGSRATGRHEATDWEGLLAGQRNVGNTTVGPGCQTGAGSPRERANGVGAPSRMRRIWSFLAGCLVLAGCASGSYDSVDLMPPPLLHQTGGFDPYGALTAESFAEQSALLYVTDRQPSGADDRPYADARGHLLRGGVATVRSTPPFRDWNDIRTVTIEGRRAQNYVLSVSEVEEIGVLPVGLTPFNVEAPADAALEEAAADFAARIDHQLALSGSEDAVIFVHGYNVGFEYPLLVSKELQHYLGYRGAFITFAWPATPSRLAYFRDLETTDATVRTLRMFAQFLTERTRARRIHLIGYSAGSRIAFGAAYRLALEAAAAPDGDPPARLGDLILLGSDIDPVYFLQGVADGLLDVTDRVAVYMSETDSALGLSNFVFAQRRLGETLGPEDLSEALEAQLARIDRLELIDVSGAEGAEAGNGHWYFRSSPWVSSDLLLGLFSDLGPADRGLTRGPGTAVWRFSDDYATKLRQAVHGNGR
jgi:esterase/lipase superfamily enzyme